MQARRETYVKKLKTFFPVDVYGKCGKLECPRNNETACFLKLEKEYKFYLSYENSLCKDYTTEKFFNIARREYIHKLYT